MAEIDWSLAKTPDYLGGALQAQAAGRQQAGINALRGYSSDPQGAINALVASGNLGAAKDAANLNQTQVERAARQSAAGKYATGDLQGAVTALAPAGDLANMDALKTQSRTEAQAKIQYRTQQATRLYTLYQQAGGDKNPAATDRMLQAFDASAPDYQSMGMTPEQTAQLRASLAQHPGAVLQALAAPPKIGFHTAGDTLIATNDDTGQALHSWTGQKFLTVNRPDSGQDVIEVGGDGGGGSGATGAGAGSGGTPAPSGGVYDQVAHIAQQNGAKPEEVAYLQRLAQVESNGKTDAQNNSSTGVFQFHPDTFHALGGKDINSVPEQTYAALQLQRHDRAALQQMGVPVTDANAYIMHQQGASGGRALLTADPNANAVAVLTPLYHGNADIARKAIVGNGGTPDMTAGQFVGMWREKWTKGAGGAGAADAPDAHGGANVVYSSSGGESDLTDDTVQLMAARYLRDGTIPPLGMKSTADRRRILNAATKMAGDLGLTAGDLVAGTADTKAAGRALAQNAGDMQRIGGFEKTASANADLALSLAPKGGSQGQVPVINRWIQAGRQSIAGDADVAKFNVALGTFADEYAKVVAGSNGSTDSVRAEAYKRVNGAMNQQQLTEVVATMKREMANRMSAMQAIDEGIHARLRGPGAAAGGPSPVQVNSLDEAMGLPPGTVFMTPDGRRKVR